MGKLKRENESEQSCHDLFLKYAKVWRKWEWSTKINTHLISILPLQNSLICILKIVYQAESGNKLV